MLRTLSVLSFLAALGLAVAVAAADESASRDRLAGWFAMLLGGGLVVRAAYRLQIGEARLKRRTVRRAENPRSFMVGITLLGLPGIALLAGGAYWLIAA